MRISRSFVNLIVWTYERERTNFSSNAKCNCRLIKTYFSPYYYFMVSLNLRTRSAYHFHASDHTSVRLTTRFRCHSARRAPQCDSRLPLLNVLTSRHLPLPNFRVQIAAIVTTVFRVCVRLSLLRSRSGCGTSRFHATDSYGFLNVFRRSIAMKSSSTI